jgi:hypothetical protein
MILIRWIFSWHLPLVPFDPLWLGLAAAVAGVALFGVWIALIIDGRRKSAAKL